MKPYVGAAYYPELWDKAEIDKDIKVMKEYGLNCMRIGEFAWSSMEKEDGVFDFSLFGYVVDKLYENGIYTVMCTPSCTPPRWFFRKYPDALRTITNNNLREKQLHNLIDVSNYMHTSFEVTTLLYLGTHSKNKNDNDNKQ